MEIGSILADGLRRDTIRILLDTFQPISKSGSYVDSSQAVIEQQVPLVYQGFPSSVVA